MSKTNNKYQREDDFDDYEIVNNREEDRRKQKRLERALKTRNIDELIELEDEGEDPNNSFFWDEDYDQR